MAKLRARGRVELLRATREWTGDEEKSSLTDWSRKTRVLCSDGHVLEKLDVRFKADGSAMSGERHSYGWKVKGKLKAGFSPADYARALERAGFTVENVLPLSSAPMRAAPCAPAKPREGVAAD